MFTTESNHWSNFQIVCIDPGASGKVPTIINFSLKTQEHKKCIGNAKH